MFARILQIEVTAQADRVTAQADLTVLTRRFDDIERQLAILQPFVNEAIVVASYSLDDWF